MEETRLNYSLMIYHLAFFLLLIDLQAIKFTRGIPALIGVLVVGADDGG
jgi:hypothetical protein